MAAGEGLRSRAFILRDFKRIQEAPNEHYSVGLINENIYAWEVMVFGPSRTPYENGIFQAQMLFPLNYPEAPPTFKFISEMWHPNIDKEGNVCISILHNPGDDEFGYETLEERWLPVRNPETVILSIISLLNAPNCDSPANIDAAQQLREDAEGYRRKVLRLTAKTLEYYDKM